MRKTKKNGTNESEKTSFYDWSCKRRKSYFSRIMLRREGARQKKMARISGLSLLLTTFQTRKTLESQNEPGSFEDKRVSRIQEYWYLALDVMPRR